MLLGMPRAYPVLLSALDETASSYSNALEPFNSSSMLRIDKSLESVFWLYLSAVLRPLFIVL